MMRSSIPESMLSAKISYNDLCEACALDKPTFDNQFELLERVYAKMSTMVRRCIWRWITNTLHLSTRTYMFTYSLIVVLERFSILY